MSNNEKFTISLNPDVLAELEWLVETHQTYGAPTKIDSVEELVSYVMGSVAEKLSCQTGISATSIGAPTLNPLISILE